MPLAHEALIYDNDNQFVDALVPFLAGGLRRGEGVIAAVTAHNIDLLRRRLGDDAGQVTFIDRDTWYRRPAATIAGWSGLLDAERARGRQSMRVVGEVEFGAATRQDTWIRYESAVNEVFVDVPARIICPYDTRRLPDRVVASARRTHPVMTAARGDSGPGYQKPAELLRDLAEPLPPVAGEALLVLDLTGPAGLRRARQTLVAVARALGWTRPAVDDLLLVTTEVAVNSLRHGRGDRRLQVWVDQRAITCEVTDHGNGPADPLAGYRPPQHPHRRGVGLWLAGQLCDGLAIDRHDGETRVRFRLTGQ
ncbi:sensor histidine kinase [Paractinoplanes rishiriensis]|uniref:Anti-sigma regulatory factor n=1 Tax=Paractinoplanes rishiriensis TaxID=1050105 RepID=A0A919MY54_9ACTN|nr:sensor histidine kinase [Actinoplanes rishiriensis]GIE99459.1 anti-sigma regulatory factor [Actinoplanes rishiriensis]